MVINCETVISNSSSHVWNERKLKWNFCRKSKSKHDTIKNKNSSFFEEKITVVKWSKNTQETIAVFFSICICREKVLWIFHSGASNARVERDGLTFVGNFYFRNLSSQFYFLALETYTLIDQCISVFVASSAKIVGIQVRSESVNFRLFPVKFLDPWTVDSNSCCCVLSMARELASIGRLLTKKYALTERDENLDRFCSKAFFVSIIRYWKYSGISSMTILGNFSGISTSWSPYFDYNKLKIGRKVWTKSHRSSRGEKI